MPTTTPFISIAHGFNKFLFLFVRLSSPPDSSRSSSRQEDHHQQELTITSPPCTAVTPTALKSPRINLPRKPSVPKATDLAHLASRSDKNHIMENRKTAIHLHPPNTQVEEKPYRHKSFGAVPDYLQQRKHEWALEEERKRRMQPDPNCPPGMRLLTEDER